MTAKIPHRTDNLPSFCLARVLILGVGNILFGNDGFASEVVRQLGAHYNIPDDIYVMDAGTGVRKILFTLVLSETTPEEILVIDTVDWGNQIGELAELSVEDLPAVKMDDFSLHQVPTSNMLRELAEGSKIHISILACDTGMIPQVIQTGLSAVIESSVDKAIKIIADRYKIQEILLSA